jgi:hypothetical protein
MAAAILGPPGGSWLPAGSLATTVLWDRLSTEGAEDPGLALARLLGHPERAVRVVASRLTAAHARPDAVDALCAMARNAAAAGHRADAFDCWHALQELRGRVGPPQDRLVAEALDAVTALRAQPPM